MTKVTLINQKSKSERLAIAHKVLNRALQPKRVYEVEDYTDLGSHFEVFYSDQNGYWHKGTIGKKLLEYFIIDFYSTVIDSQINGEHFQFQDTMNTADYLEENLTGVITDFLNNRKELTHV